jgi:hypothetical protein
MSAFAIMQALVIGLIVTLSAWQAFRKLLPGTSKRVHSALARRLDRPGRAAAVRALGRWLQPTEAKSGGCGTGNGCSSCGGCAPARPVADEVEPQPLHFRERR